MTFVADIQNEIPSLASRWKLDDPVGSYFVTDDVGGINLLTNGVPVFSLPSLTKNDIYNTSVLGGYGASPNYFSELGVAAYTTHNGITLEGCSMPDPNGNGFNLISLPGQAQLQINGFSVVFNVWIGTTLHALTATNVLDSWPQHIVGVYDAVAQLQMIYIDGQLAASQSLSGSVGTFMGVHTTGAISTSSFTITGMPSTLGMQAGGTVAGDTLSIIPANTIIQAVASSTSLAISKEPTSNSSNTDIIVGMPVSIAFPLTTSPTIAAVQNVAVYTAPLSANRIAQIFQAFRQILSDPGHVRTFPQIGVYS